MFQLFVRKMNSSLCKICILLFLIWACDSVADGRYAGATLDLGVGARTLALGEAAAAMVGGAECFRYNPAALGLIRRPEIGLMYAPTFGSLSSPMAIFHYIGFVLPMAAGGTVGLHWTRFTVDDIPLYPKLDGDSYVDRLNNPELRPTGQADGSFNDVEDAYYISFSRSIKTTLPLGWLYIDLPVEVPLGVNVKILHQSLHQSTASGVGLDFGLMFKFSLATLFDLRPLGELCIGFSALDVTRTTLLWNNDHSEQVRTTYLTGLAYKQKIAFYDLITNLFWTWRHKYNKESLFGAEFSLKGFALRLGYNKSGLTAGAGWQLWRFRIDYAFSTLDLDNVHRLSCAFLL